MKQCVIENLRYVHHGLMVNSFQGKEMLNIAEITPVTLAIIKLCRRH